MIRIFVRLCDCAQVAVSTGMRGPARNGLGEADSKVNDLSPTSQQHQNKKKKNEKEVAVVAFPSSSAPHFHPMRLALRSPLRHPSITRLLAAHERRSLFISQSVS